MMAKQLALGLEGPSLFLEEDFYLCAANQFAYQTISSWPEWPASGVVYLSGEKGSGKSHLASLWQRRSGAFILCSSSLTKGFVLEQSQESLAFVLEDIEKIQDEIALFHLLNFIKETRGALLLTSRFLPGVLSFTLPDLMSRLKSVSLVTLEKPDDHFLRMLLIKRFSDLQLKIEASSLDYILKHLTRSYESLDDFVRFVDKLSWQEKRPVTIPFLRRVFSLMG